MALTDNGGLSAADVAAVVGNNGNGFGFGNDGGGLFWLLVLFLFGFGNNGWGNGGYANVGSEIYPWMNQSQQINDGFRDQMINSVVDLRELMRPLMLPRMVLLSRCMLIRLRT